MRRSNAAAASASSRWSPAAEPAFPASQEGDAIDEQRRAHLWAAVQALPVTDRQVTVLHFEGLTARDIEAVTGLSAGSVATRLTRIRQKLAARVRGDDAVDEERRA